MSEPDQPRRAPLENLDADEVERILAMKKSAIVAFVDARGFPRMLPCWFVWDGTAFYTTSDPEKFHVRALRANDRASFCVEHVRMVAGRYRGNRQVKGVGRVEIFPDDDAQWLGRILQKYLGRSAWPTGRAANRVVLRLQPERLSAHGGDVDWDGDA
jgi:nitroimidazol reductase NimA-like FMN-containing flavoprotein (pyridoxamine 5'-phosphate oxidase superfamily)